MRLACPGRKACPQIACVAARPPPSTSPGIPSLRPPKASSIQTASREPDRQPDRPPTAPASLRSLVQRSPPPPPDRSFHRESYRRLVFHLPPIAVYARSMPVAA